MEIEFKNLSDNLKIIIICIIVIGLFATLFYAWEIGKINRTIEDVPHKVCHNETEYGSVIVMAGNYNIKEIMDSYDIKEYVCLSEKSLLNYQMVCKEIKSTKEVCEIK